MKKRKVLHIATRFLHGGSERDLVEAIRALPKDEYENCLMVGPEHQPDLIQQMIPPECRVEVEAHLIREVSPLHDVLAAASIGRFIGRNRFDVVHTCQSKAGIVGRLAASAAGTPAILHSLTMANFFEHGRKSMSITYRGAERVAARWTDAYFVVGTDLMQRYLRAGVADAGRFHVVRSPIDLTGFREVRALTKEEARARLKLPTEEPLVAYVGSLEERKGVTRLPAYLGGLQSLTRRRIRLVIAGDGPMESEVRARFAALGLSDCVTFLGFTDQVPTVMAAADCLVLLSDAEGLPQVLVQAAAARLPFVSFPVDGANEILQRGAAGTRLEEDDPVAAARATLQYLRPCQARSVDLGEWSSAAVQGAYRRVFAAQTERLDEPRTPAFSRRGAGARGRVPA